MRVRLPRRARRPAPKTADGYHSSAAASRAGPSGTGPRESPTAVPPHGRRRFTCILAPRSSRGHTTSPSRDSAEPSANVRWNGPAARLCYNERPGAGTARATHLRKWRNWQTHQLEGLAFARTWGFESPLPHQALNTDQAVAAPSQLWRQWARAPAEECWRGFSTFVPRRPVWTVASSFWTLTWCRLAGPPNGALGALQPVLASRLQAEGTSAGFRQASKAGNGTSGSSPPCRPRTGGRQEGAPPMRLLEHTDFERAVVPAAEHSARPAAPGARRKGLLRHRGAPSRALSMTR